MAQSENPQASPGAMGKSPEGGGGAARNGNLEPSSENLGGKVSEAVPNALIVGPASSETPAAQPPTALLSGAGQSGSLLVANCSLSEVKPSADPFFSGRKHFPELDGLRGVAISLVLVCHYCSVLPVGGWLVRAGQTGWVGVNLFFVLSGFLITGILCDSKGQGYFFRNFYARRALRVFPLYFGVLGVELAALLAIRAFHPGGWGHGDVPQALLTQQPWYWTYTSNIGFSLFHVDPLFQGHFWSLAVEEQFYLVWPLIVFVTPRRRLLLVCCLLAVAGTVSRPLMTALGFPFYPSIYFFTVPQFEALGAGAIAAVMARRASGGGLAVGYRVAAVSGAAVALLAYLAGGLAPAYSAGGDAVAHARLLNGLASDVFCTGCDVGFLGLVGCVASPGAGLLRGLFRIGALRTLGKYSYGLYVYHYLLLGIAQAAGNRVGVTEGGVPKTMVAAFWFVLANFLASLGLAFASYHLYEKRFLRLKKYFPERATNALTEAHQVNIQARKLE